MAKCKAFTGSAVKWLKYHLAVHTSRVLPVFSVPAVRCSVFFSLAISVALRRSFVSRDVTVLQTYPDLFCLSETSWIKHTTTSTELAHCKPPNYCLLCTARPLNRNNPPGTGILIRETFTRLLSSEHNFTSFESSSVTLKLLSSKISEFNVCRYFYLHHMPRLTSGTNFLLYFVNQFHLSMPTSIHLSLLHFLNPSLIHCFILNSKLTFLINPFHHRSLTI